MQPPYGRVSAGKIGDFGLSLPVRFLHAPFTLPLRILYSSCTLAVFPGPGPGKQSVPGEVTRHAEIDRGIHAVSSFGGLAVIPRRRRGLDPWLCVAGFCRVCRSRDVGKVQLINDANVNMVPYRHVKDENQSAFLTYILCNIWSRWRHPGLRNSWRIPVKGKTGCSFGSLTWRAALSVEILVQAEWLEVTGWLKVINE